MTTYLLQAPTWSAKLAPTGNWIELRSLLEQLGVRIIPIPKHDTVEIEHEGALYSITYDGPRVLSIVRHWPDEPAEALSTVDLPDDVRSALVDLIVLSSDDE